MNPNHDGHADKEVRLLLGVQRVQHLEKEMWCTDQGATLIIIGQGPSIFDIDFLSGMDKF